MSNSHNTPSEIKLIADSGYPYSEVSILNSEYETVKSGVGRVEVSLPCGLYKVQYRAGSAFDEKLIELSNQSEEVHAPKPEWVLKTAAPIAGAMPNVSEFQQAASEMSKGPTITTGGKGSGVLLFVVDSSKDAKSPVTVGASTLQLLTFSGELLAKAPPLSCGERWAGCNVELAPGTYLLRIEHTGCDPLEQTVVASETWQTQVFVPLDYLSSHDTLMLPDLSNAAVLMSHLESGFSPNAQEYAWTEAARQELALGRPVIPEQRIRGLVKEAQSIKQSATSPGILHQMLREKFTNPMLGIYAAHLMMMKADADLELLRELARNLRILLGEHPDVIAIDLWIDPTIRVAPMPLPPMLRSSWAVFVNRSRTLENLVPSGSYAARISDRLWGAGAWLVWQTPVPLSLSPPTPAEGVTEPSGLSTFFEKLGLNLPGAGGAGAYDLAVIIQWAREKIEAETKADFLRTQAEMMGLSGLEQNVFAHVIELTTQMKFIQRVSETLARVEAFGTFRVLFQRLVPPELLRSAEAAVIKQLSTDGLIQTLGVPRAVVNDAIAGLVRKFNEAKRRGEV